MPRPTLRCALLLVAGLPLALLPALVDVRLWAAWLAYIAAAFLAVGADALLALAPALLRVEASVPDALFIGESDPIAIVLRAGAGAGRRAPRREEVLVLCDLDPDLAPQPAASVRLGEDGSAQIAVPLVPLRRGTVRVHAVWLRWTGPFGLTARVATLAIEKDVAVLPNTRAVRAAALRFFSDREFLAGLKVEHYLGDGSEFESLREWMPGLDPRTLDWKATARHRKLLCREYRAERNHQVILALDTGHLMSEPLLGIPRLDHALNAVLLLALVCLRTGDRVGLFAFDEKVRAFVEPQGGVHGLRLLQQRSAELDYSTGETNFTLGLTDLSGRLRRRSLVVVLTDFVDTVTAELMIENLDRLARRHLVVFVTLRDPELERVALAEPRSMLDLSRAVVASDIARERDVVLRRLQRQGVGCIDAAPEEVSAQLINRYLDIKRREKV